MSASSASRWTGLLGLVAATALVAALTISPAASAHRHEPRHEPPATQHVLLLSVDGLHQTDLEYYVRKNPTSALAQLSGDGVEFTRAQTPVPSDSFPGMVAQVTGGNPSSTGVYYDDTWNHALLPAGTTSCAGVTPGPRGHVLRATR